MQLVENNELLPKQAIVIGGLKIAISALSSPSGGRKVSKERVKRGTVADVPMTPVIETPVPETTTGEAHLPEQPVPRNRERSEESQIEQRAEQANSVVVERSLQEVPEELDVSWPSNCDGSDVLL